jgi:hypothetical protein
MIALVWYISVALAGDPVITLPGTSEEVTFEPNAEGAVEDAMALLSARKFDDAARAFSALADSSSGADYRYLEAVARYEAGELRLADRAARSGLDRKPEHGPLLSLEGLVQADLGKGDVALQTLDKAEKFANGDATLLGRIALNRGLVQLDRGEAAGAQASFESARSRGQALNDQELVDQASQNLALVAALRGEAAGAQDPLGQVSDKLRAGDVAGAKAAIPKAIPGDRRQNARTLLALGNVLRADGQLDEALAAFDKAAGIADEGGLVRERAMALAQMGVVDGLGNRPELAIDKLQQAIGLVAGTSFRVNEVNFRVEAGRWAVRHEDVDQARSQLAVARKVAVGVEDPMVPARLSELEAAIGAKTGDAAVASAGYSMAISAYEGKKYWAEAARVGTELVELDARTASAQLAADQQRTRKLFEAAQDPVGPAHVLIATGLGKAAGKDNDGALAAFVEGAKVAESAGGRGKRVAVIAREDAAQVLMSQGQTGVDAAKLGLDGAVERSRAFAAAEKEFETSRKAFDAHDYDAARDGFARADKALADLGEAGYAAKARRNRLWSAYNAAADDPLAPSVKTFRTIAEEASRLPDAELRARAAAAAALAASQVGEPEARTELRAAADLAEQMGLVSIAGQCNAELAEKETTFEAKYLAARRAYDQRDADKLGTYAMYSVAVDAFNDGDYAKAQEIAQEILPKSGTLRPDVEKVLANVKSAQK